MTAQSSRNFHGQDTTKTDQVHSTPPPGDIKVYKWARHPIKGKGYEVSSIGDKRFSAFVARLGDGRTIECHYQCCVKGYDPGGTNWRLGKGKRSLKKKHLDNPESLFEDYLTLWKEFAKLNPHLISILRERADAQGGILTDRFAKTEVNQARALATILSLITNRDET